MDVSRYTASLYGMVCIPLRHGMDVSRYTVSLYGTAWMCQIYVSLYGTVWMCPDILPPSTTRYGCVPIYCLPLRHGMDVSRYTASLYDTVWMCPDILHPSTTRYGCVPIYCLPLRYGMDVSRYTASLYDTVWMCPDILIPSMTQAQTYPPPDHMSYQTLWVLTPQVKTRWCRVNANLGQHTCHLNYRYNPSHIGMPCFLCLVNFSCRWTPPNRQ